MELTIDGKVYGFKFGTKFIRELDKQFPINQEGIQYGMALQAKTLPELQTANVNTLANVLKIANATEKERVTLDQLDDFIDNTQDIEALFDEVIKEISESNAGKLAAKSFKEQMKKRGK